ncbi:hypothetical protein [Paenibacillus alvei]|uniref:Uncharacterized protein n=1 Tax=Paenibacillus alvei TaxID=44250 RepID=A0A383RCK8_PAEAL|nr:hypothetical protein [Paenibacillus alvei]SYX84029.1 conserved protein of unknown function [Paenibacillus alvei]
MNDFFTQMASKILLVRSTESSSAFALPDLREGALASLALQPQMVASLWTPEPALLGGSRVGLLERNENSEDEGEPHSISSLVKRSRPLVRREEANSESVREDEGFSTLRSASTLQHELITTASRQSAVQKERLQLPERLPIVPQQANVFSPNTDMQKERVPTVPQSVNVFSPNTDMQKERVPIVPQSVNVFSPNTDMQKPHGVPQEQNQTEQPQQLIRPVGMTRFESVFSPTMHVQQNHGVQPREQPRQTALREAKSTVAPHVVKVSIGRVDVRALVTSTPSRQVSQIAAPRSDLQEYLEARNQGKL